MRHFIMLQRILLYTGVTRGKKLVVLVGQKKAVAIAVKNASNRRQWSKLDEWLKQLPIVPTSKTAKSGGTSVAERDPTIVVSGLSGDFANDGVMEEVHIIRLEDEKNWTLEVVNSSGTSIVWGDPFESDEQAYAEFLRTVAEEGMAAFADEDSSSNVITFPRPN